MVRPAFEFNVLPAVKPSGELEGTWNLLSVDQPNVIVASVKKAEDDQDLIVRFYEAGKSTSHARIKFGIPVTEVMDVNLLEEKAEPVTLEGNEVELTLRPFEIKTLKVKL